MKKNETVIPSSLDGMTKNENLPPLLQDRKYYQSLISNKHKSFRREMYNEISEIEFPIFDFETWKRRFLNPVKNIPKNDLPKTAIVMQEFLARKIEEQQDYLKTEYNKIDAVIDAQKEKQKDLLNKIEIGKEAIEIYKNWENAE